MWDAELEACSGLLLFDVRKDDSDDSNYMSYAERRELNKRYKLNSKYIIIYKISLTKTSLSVDNNYGYIDCNFLFL